MSCHARDAYQVRAGLHDGQERVDDVDCAQEIDLVYSTSRACGGADPRGVDDSFYETHLGCFLRKFRNRRVVCDVQKSGLCGVSLVGQGFLRNGEVVGQEVREENPFADAEATRDGNAHAAAADDDENIGGSHSVAGCFWSNS